MVRTLWAWELVLRSARSWEGVRTRNRTRSGLADDLAVVADDGVWLVDDREDLSEVESLLWVDSDHSGDEVDQLRTVAEFSHEAELLVDALAVESEGLHVVEVGQRIVAGGAERCDAQCEDFVLFVMNVANSSVLEAASEVGVFNFVVVYLVLVKETLDTTAVAVVDWSVD